MRILAWDTSSLSGAIAALEIKSADSAAPFLKLLAEWSLQIEVKHSDSLLWGIHTTLEAARWKLSDVDLFGVGLGPGSFTGLRVGITTARTLAHTLNKPLVGVSSLLALAHPLADQWVVTGQPDTLIVAATDACKGELFALWGSAAQIRCKFQGSGDLTPPSCEGVFTYDSLYDQLKKEFEPESQQDRKWVAIGEAVDRYPSFFSKFSQTLRAELPGPFCHAVQGRSVGILCWDAWKSRAETLLSTSPLEVFPRYLRASSAEVTLAARTQVILE